MVCGFRLVKVPLLLVGEEFDDDEDENDFGENAVVNIDVVAFDSGNEEEDVGWGCDGEEEELGGCELRYKIQ